MAGHPSAKAASNALSLLKGFARDFSIGPLATQPIAMPDLFAAIACPTPAPGFFWVYILQSADGSLYIGQTNNLPERLRKHRLGLGSKHTHDHAQPRLVYYEGPVALADAVQRERQLKRWSRAKKEALVRGDLASLSALSRSSVSRSRAPACPGQV